MPKEHDSELSRIQGSVLASARPLVSAWQNLLEEGIEKDPAMMVPATEVLAMIQRTLCLVGNASERLSQVRRAKILEAIDPSWKKFSEDSFPSTKDTLFGVDFQSSLTSRVEKDTALSKAVAISKRSRRDPDPSSRKDRPKSSRVFSRGPSWKVRNQAGQEFLPVQRICSKKPTRREAPPIFEVRQETPLSRAQAPTGSQQSYPNPTEEALNMLRSLPEGGLSPLGITMDTSIARKEALRPVVGRIAHFIDNWDKISSDPWVREAVCGHKQELRATPRQLRRPRLGEMDTTKAQILTKEVDDLVAKGAITECVDDGGGFVSPLFLVPKSDGSWRPVINLRDLNLYVAASHFKMESVRTVKTIIQRDDWMLKLDLKDAYLSVPIHRAHQKYLRFRWGGRLWVLPFGLSSAPQTFTKLMKPVVSTLRKLGFRLILYLDDMLMMAHSKEEARKGLAAAMELLCSLGFIINVKKSVFTPARTIEFLGFTLDSASMTISLPQHKLKEIRRSAGQLLRQRSMPARQLARLLGMIVAAHPAVLPAPLHSRFLERAKRRAVQGQRGYDAMVRLESNAAQDLQWWVDSAANFNGRPLQIPKWDRVVESDASLRGWGGFLTGEVHRRPMDSGRTETPYQLSGTPGGIPGTEVVRWRPARDFDSPLAGQCDGNRLSQQDGRNSFDSPVRSGSGDLELVHQPEDNNPCRTPPRCGEREGGLGITPPDRFQRLDAPTRGVCPDAGHGGPILDRPFRVEDQCTASGVLQLEAGPTCPGSGRFLHTMEGSQAIPVPPICADSPVPQQDNRGGDNSSADSPSLAEPGHCIQPRRPETSTGGGRPSPSSRVVCVGRSCSTQGLSERVTDIIRKSWRASTESAYSNAWRQWVGWCLERETDPLSAPVRDILEFLCERFEAGKQYRTINTLRSAISMTHEEVDGVRVGQHPMVSRFLKGVFNLRPPAPKYSDLECGCGSGLPWWSTRQ